MCLLFFLPSLKVFKVTIDSFIKKLIPFLILMSERFQSKSHNWWKCKHLQLLSTGSKLLLESPYAPRYIPGWVNHRCRVQSMKNALRLKK